MGKRALRDRTRKRLPLLAVRSRRSAHVSLRLPLLILIVCFAVFAVSGCGVNLLQHPDPAPQESISPQGTISGQDPQGSIVEHIEQEIIPFEEVQPMFEAHKEDLELLYSAFEKRFKHINISFNSNAQTFAGGLMLLDDSYVSFEKTGKEEMSEYIDDQEAVDAAARVLSELGGMIMSYVEADEDLGREATFTVTLYPGIVSIELGTTVTGYEDLWQELGDGWHYSVWRCPDG